MQGSSMKTLQCCEEISPPPFSRRTVTAWSTPTVAAPAVTSTVSSLSSIKQKRLKQQEFTKIFLRQLLHESEYNYLASFLQQYRHTNRKRKRKRCQEQGIIYDITGNKDINTKIDEARLTIAKILLAFHNGSKAIILKYSSCNGDDGSGYGYNYVPIELLAALKCEQRNAQMQMSMKAHVKTSCAQAQKEYPVIRVSYANSPSIHQAHSFLRDCKSSGDSDKSTTAYTCIPILTLSKQSLEEIRQGAIHNFIRGGKGLLDAPSGLMVQEGILTPFSNEKDNSGDDQLVDADSKDLYTYANDALGSSSSTSTRSSLYSVANAKQMGFASQNHYSGQNGHHLPSPRHLFQSGEEDGHGHRYQNSHSIIPMTCGNGDNGYIEINPVINTVPDRNPSVSGEEYSYKYEHEQDCEYDNEYFKEKANSYLQSHLLRNRHNSGLNPLHTYSDMDDDNDNESFFTCVREDKQANAHYVPMRTFTDKRRSRIIWIRIFYVTFLITAFAFGCMGYPIRVPFDLSVHSPFLENVNKVFAKGPTSYVVDTRKWWEETADLGGSMALVLVESIHDQFQHFLTDMHVWLDENNHDHDHKYGYEYAQVIDVLDRDATNTDVAANTKELEEALTYGDCCIGIASEVDFISAVTGRMGSEPSAVPEQDICVSKERFFVPRSAFQDIAADEDVDDLVDGTLDTWNEWLISWFPAL